MVTSSTLLELTSGRRGPAEVTEQTHTSQLDPIHFNHIHLVQHTYYK